MKRLLLALTNWIIFLTMPLWFGTFAFLVLIYEMLVGNIDGTWATGKRWMW
jgi:hypothetical protein